MSRHIAILITTLCLFFAGAQVTAQVYQSDPAFGRQFNRLRGSILLTPPYYQDSASLPTHPIVYAGSTKSDSTTGSLAFTRVDSTLWYYTGYSWLRIAKKGESSSAAPCDTCITEAGYRSGDYIDTFYTRNANGVTDWYYLPAPDGLYPGTGIVTPTGNPREYYVSAATFRKRGTTYTTRDTTLTVPAPSPDSSRTDIFIATISGINTTIQGIEGSTNILQPQFGLDTAVFLTHVNLTPSNPSGYQDTVVLRDEGNAGEGTGSISGSTANYLSTTTPYRLTYTTETGALNNGDILSYTRASSLNQTQYDGVSFFIRLKSIMANNNNLYVSFWNAGSQVSTEVAIPLNKSNTTNYQGISIGFASFGWTNSLFDRISFRYGGSGAGITGMFVDFVYLQNGLPPVVVGGDFVQRIRRNGDDVEQMLDGIYSPAFSIVDKANKTTELTFNGEAGITFDAPTTQSLAANRTWTARADTAGTLASKDWTTARLGDLDFVDSVTYSGDTLYEWKNGSASVRGVITAGGGGIDQLTGDVTAGPGTGSQAATIAANAVTDAKFRQSVGLSVVGRSANTTGNVADITASTDHHVLRRSGTGIGFGTINAAAMNGTYTNGQMLQTDGSGNLSWVTGGGGGVTTMGAIGASPNANGATITGATLNLQPASGSFGGVVTTGAQTFSGLKTFNNGIIVASGQSINMTGGANYEKIILYDGGVAASRSGISHYSSQLRIFAPAGDQIRFYFGGAAGTSPTYISSAQISTTGTIETSSYFKNTSITGEKWRFYDGGSAGTRSGFGQGAYYNMWYVPNIDAATINGSGDFAALGTNERARFTQTGVSFYKGSASHASAVAEISSTTGGFLPPRMTAAQRNAIGSPATGLMVYSTDENRVNYFSTSWRELVDNFNNQTIGGNKTFTGIQYNRNFDNNTGGQQEVYIDHGGGLSLYQSIDATSIFDRYWVDYYYPSGANRGYRWYRLGTPDLSMQLSNNVFTLNAELGNALNLYKYTDNSNLTYDKVIFYNSGGNKSGIAANNFAGLSRYHVNFFAPSTAEYSFTLSNGGESTPTNAIMKMDRAGIVLGKPFVESTLTGVSNTLNASALVEIRTTTKGFLPPRHTTAERDLVSTPAQALTVFNTTTLTNDVHDGTAWRNQPNGLKGSATLDFGSTSAQTSADLTITVTGAAVGDIVIVGNPSADANSCYTAWVSATNTVTVRFNNYSSGSIDPASGTFKVYVIKN